MKSLLSSEKKGEDLKNGLFLMLIGIVLIFVYFISNLHNWEKWREKLWFIDKNCLNCVWIKIKYPTPTSILYKKT